LSYLEQQAVGQAITPGFLQEHNPIVRHTVLRRRQTLEDARLLERIGVNIHPDPNAPATTYPGVGFSGLGLLTNHPFNLAYQAAEAFTVALRQRTKSGWVYEDASLATHLFQLCFWAVHRGKNVAPGGA